MFEPDYIMQSEPEEDRPLSLCGFVLRLSPSSVRVRNPMGQVLWFERLCWGGPDPACLPPSLQQGLQQPGPKALSGCDFLGELLYSSGFSRETEPAGSCRPGKR